MGNYINFLDDFYLKHFKKIKGTNMGEIKQLENKFKVKFPEAYIEFLLKYGKKSYLMDNYLMSIDRIEENKKSAKYVSFDEIDNIKVEIKESYFFFGQWQGYEFYFFDCSDENEDPPIYTLTDCPEIKKHKNSFTDFLKFELNNKNFT